MRNTITVTAIALALTLMTSIGAKATEWKKLLSPAEAAAMSAALKIDIRESDGKASYAEGHPEGAVSAPYGLWRGPADNPGQPLDDIRLSALLSSIGVERDRPIIIVYQGADTTDFGAAARVYWTLKSSGVERIAILDGGVKAWAEADLPLSTEPTAPTPSAITASLSTEWMATRADVQAIVAGNTAGTLVDARPDAFFLGKQKHPAAATAGTLPDAEQFAFGQWFKGNDPTVGGGLLAKYRKPEGEGPIVSFCNTGHWAATNWFMMSEMQGIEGVKLYPESMVGWTNASRKVVTQ
jgi:thiosulfate/3-mercaptopyruvate sulfurtransferase